MQGIDGLELSDLQPPANPRTPTSQVQTRERGSEMSVPISTGQGAGLELRNKEHLLPRAEKLPMLAHHPPDPKAGWVWFHPSAAK